MHNMVQREVVSGQQGTSLSLLDVKDAAALALELHHKRKNGVVSTTNHNYSRELPAECKRQRHRLELDTNWNSPQNTQPSTDTMRAFI